MLLPRPLHRSPPPVRAGAEDRPPRASGLPHTLVRTATVAAVVALGALWWVVSTSEGALAATVDRLDPAEHSVQHHAALAPTVGPAGAMEGAPPRSADPEPTPRWKRSGRRLSHRVGPAATAGRIDPDGAPEAPPLPGKASRRAWSVHAPPGDTEPH